MEEIIKEYSGALISFVAGILFITYLVKVCVGRGQIYMIIENFFNNIGG